MSQKHKDRFIQFRKEEIANAIAKSKLKLQKNNYFEEQKQLPWYKRRLYINIFFSSLSLIIIIGLLLIAFFIGKTF
ncbi:hypothetical protein BCF59_0630 [Mycoplasmopsis mustelae]|uniref:Uncharacterized protein n=1 Tax=Mycoplasmopsis mustelae TaxID=171289 RepID=A0A4R7UE69_9BACT|nr:hypothetical protein [Mycoplasmopsis mustelae]TDV23284.1 hypothetical protein BCF59_0630 [Mycoplasmopsis mustelae]